MVQGGGRENSSRLAEAGKGAPAHPQSTKIKHSNSQWRLTQARQVFLLLLAQHSHSETWLRIRALSEVGQDPEYRCGVNSMSHRPDAEPTFRIPNAPPLRHRLLRHARFALRQHVSSGAVRASRDKGAHRGHTAAAPGGRAGDASDRWSEGLQMLAVLRAISMRTLQACRSQDAGPAIETLPPSPARAVMAKPASIQRLLAPDAAELVQPPSRYEHALLHRVPILGNCAVT